MLYSSQNKKKTCKKPIFGQVFFWRIRSLSWDDIPIILLMSLNTLFGVFNCFTYLKSLPYDKSSHGNFVLSFRNTFFSICIKCLSVVTFCSLFFTVGEYLLFLQLTFYFTGYINQKYPGTKFSLPVAIITGIKWLFTFAHSVAGLSSLESQNFIMRLFGLTDRGVHYPCFASVIGCHLIFLHSNWAVSINF